MNVISLREAKAQGLPRYYTGLPCKRGHIVERRTGDHTCIGCNTAAKRGGPGKGPTPRTAQPADWPPERNAELTRLVDEGWSYSAIGKHLGITKNSAIGRAKRMFLVHPNSPLDKPVTLAQRLDALNLFPSSGGCVFPLGHPGDAGFHFCSVPVAEVAAPYCDLHKRKTYLAAKEKSGGVFGYRAAE